MTESCLLRNFNDEYRCDYINDAGKFLPECIIFIVDAHGILRKICKQEKHRRIPIIYHRKANRM